MNPGKSRRPVVAAVHGGAGRLAKPAARHPVRLRYDPAIAHSLRAAQRVLLAGGSAVRAVTTAVTVLEDDGHFNAGRGSVLCEDGSVELSASVVSGRNLAAGAMVGLRRTKNPVLAARALMNHSHGLLFGSRGDSFAEDAGLEMAPPEYFLTRERKEQWRRHAQRGAIALDPGDDESENGTVGAVALDRRGHLAAATSTGGLVNQLRGRVGDTPVVGAGIWADHACAISATGAGDAFARVAFARRVADLIELAKRSPEEAALQTLEDVRRLKGQGGCIVVSATGEISCPFISPQMVRGWIVDRGLPTVGILPGEAIPISDIP